MSELICDQRAEHPGNGQYALSGACFVMAAVAAPLVGADLSLGFVPLSLTVLGVAAMFLPRTDFGPARAMLGSIVLQARQRSRAAGLGDRVQRILPPVKTRAVEIGSWCVRELSLGTGKLVGMVRLTLSRDHRSGAVVH